MITLLIVPIAVYLLVYGLGDDLDLTLWWVVWMFGLLLLHEGTHAVAWKLASKLPWSAFTFGVQWKTATPYCHSTEPMGVQAYRIGALMPLFVTGLLPWGVSLAAGYPDLAFASAFLISGASGDLYVLWSMRDLPNDVLVQDHDTKAGCVVLWPEDPRRPDTKPF